MSCLTGMLQGGTKDCERIKDLMMVPCRCDGTIMRSLKQNPEHVLGMSIAQAFPNWQEHPVSILHKVQCIVYCKPLENNSFTTKIQQK